MNEQAEQFFITEVVSAGECPSGGLEPVEVETHFLWLVHEMDVNGNTVYSLDSTKKEPFDRVPSSSFLGQQEQGIYKQLENT